jgi:hypothetical protein
MSVKFKARFGSVHFCNFTEDIKELKFLSYFKMVLILNIELGINLNKIFDFRSV